MKLIALAISLLIGNAGIAFAQMPAADAHGGDVSVMYEWMHTNTTPSRATADALV